MSSSATSTVLLRADGVGVVLDVDGDGVPRVVHWGADPGPLDEAALAGLVRDVVPATPGSAFDEPVQLTVLPGEPDGWSGRPAVRGHRDGAGVFTRLRLVAPPSRATGDTGAQVVTFTSADAVAGVSIETSLRLEPQGLLRVRHTLTNTGPGMYSVEALEALLPVPAQARELFDLTGRWCRERSPQRQPFAHGTYAREGRRGRSGHDAPLLLAVGTPAFGTRTGQVWAAHVAWSGNAVHLAQRLPEGAGAGGAGVLGGGELLLPGEVRLAPGETYESPWVVFTWSANGLDGASDRVIAWLRARPQHPRRPRPLVLNTWEAVYFDHRMDRLTALAERAAQLGVERFVLDDGWFGSRRDDSKGLGDWYVSHDVWPEGLRPLADVVRGLGMEFGLWVEPEMVNPDSELARAHPDWLLAPSPAPGAGVDLGRLPKLWRRQVVLDLSRPEAFGYLLERLSALVDEIGIAYFKWDHNRDLHESLTPLADPNGPRRAGVHAQTLALYRLLDALRDRHPGLEIESCASGGGRVDLGILQHTDRVWASDTNDALERQTIQRWTGLLVPPELVGTHIGPAHSHTTGRVLDLSFRAVTAFFGHAGLEWDVTACTPEEARFLQGWAAAYKELRHLLHTGDVVRAEHPDPGCYLHGVVSADRTQALFAYVRLTTSPDTLPGRLCLPGLDPDAEYDVVRRDDIGLGHGIAHQDPPWWAAGRATATGAVLERVGLAAPSLNPAQAVVVHLTSRSD